MAVLVTCPPMLGMIDNFHEYANSLGLRLHPAQTTQILQEEELIKLLPSYDGWIIGDDPATKRVFEVAKKGNLKAAVKWGVGIDNVDFEACKKLNIPITNTPNMFGGEVADLAIGYLVGLARQSYFIDREIRSKNAWPKPAGQSISGTNIGIVGFGDIGRNVTKRLSGFDVNVTIYDPYAQGNPGFDFASTKSFPEGLEDLNYLIFTCALNESNHHMLNSTSLQRLKDGASIINVARGPLIDENALIAALKSGKVSSAALDVFEEEPLPITSPLREMPQCIFGSHNGSNTTEGVSRASFTAIDALANYLYE